MENEPASTIPRCLPARRLPAVEISVGVTAAMLLVGVSGRAATQEVGDVTRAFPRGTADRLLLAVPTSDD